LSDLLKKIVDAIFRACKRCAEFKRLLRNWRLLVSGEWCIQEKSMLLPSK